MSVGVAEDVGELAGEHVELVVGHLEARQVRHVGHLFTGQSLRHRVRHRRADGDQRL